MTTQNGRAFNEWLRTQLKAKKMSQRQLAERAGLSLRTFQRLERLEMDNPPIRYLTNIALVLNCSLEDLIEPAWRAWKQL